MASEPIAISIKPGSYGQAVPGSLGGGGLTGSRLPGRTHFVDERAADAKQGCADAGRPAVRDELEFEI